ncbi:Uncharacterised protein [Kingella potus]|uniref:Uncharacterized protein n=1 Tax=Kingella potus TaxID=265175 RepID=A0A377QZ36_9NEIS|nr:hypothetical protein [Kingella potus]STQ99828.1 Uncharacterised protein [Kingella potus]
MRPSEMLKLHGRPIAYFPQLAKPLGGVNASILFSHFFYWNDKGESDLGIYRTAEEIEMETGLSVQEQRTARAKLRERGVLVETEKRIEHRIYYRLDLDAFDALMLQHSGSGESTAPKCKSNSPEMQKQHSGSEESTADEMQNQHSYIRTEDYQKTTAVDYNRNITREARCVSANRPSESLADRPSEKPAAPPKPAKPAKRQPSAARRELDALNLLADRGIDGDLARDYLAVRRDKRSATLTKTALDGLEREANRAGLSLEQALTLCCERGWVGFCAQWLHEHRNPAVRGNSVKDTPIHTVGGAFLAKDVL